MFAALLQHRHIIWQLLIRDIRSRYKGSVMGLLWAIVTPLMMLSVYAFVFMSIFKTRWLEADVNGEPANFVMVLYLGLIIHGLAADILSRSPRLFIEHVNFVKKVVFPLEILSLIVLLNAIFNFVICLLLLLLFVLFELQTIPLHAFWLPMILLPYFFILLGISWVVSALGVYLRDIQHIVGTLIMLLMFMSPIFYSIEMVPQRFRWLIQFNPVAFPIEAGRNVLIYGKSPDLIMLLCYSIIAVCALIFGYIFFQKTRAGFADVL